MTAWTSASQVLAGNAALAEDGTYTPQGGSPVELKVAAGQGVILTPAEEVIQAFDTGARRPGAMVASITQEAVPARPQDGDTLVVGAKTFTIRSAEPDVADVFWELDLDPA